MFEAVEHVDYRDRPGAEIEERILGTFESESEAIDVARAARAVFDETQSHDYTWWVVRQAGARLARWIADSRSGKEYVLDLRSGQLVEMS